MFSSLHHSLSLVSQRKERPVRNERDRPPPPPHQLKARRGLNEGNLWMVNRQSPNACKSNHFLLLSASLQFTRSLTLSVRPVRKTIWSFPWCTGNCTTSVALFLLEFPLCFMNVDKRPGYLETIVNSLAVWHSIAESFWVHCCALWSWIGPSYRNSACSLWEL